MTDHDDMAAERDVAAEERDVAADFAGQDLEDTAWQKEQESHGCLGARDRRRKALDGSPLGEPVLDWSGINVSTRARIAQCAAASLSWG